MKLSMTSCAVWCAAHISGLPLALGFHFADECRERTLAIGSGILVQNAVCGYAIENAEGLIESGLGCIERGCRAHGLYRFAQHLVVGAIVDAAAARLADPLDC